MTMMTAQNLLGKKKTKKYSVLLYLSTMQENDAKVLSSRAPYRYSCFTRINARGISKINDGRCFP
jgi:hypothetical protein